MVKENTHGERNSLKQFQRDEKNLKNVCDKILKDQGDYNHEETIQGLIDEIKEQTDIISINEKLDELLDLKNGIRRYIDTKNKVLIRDARSINGHQDTGQDHSYIAYLMNYLNITLAANDVKELLGVQNDVDYKSKAIAFLHENLDTKDINPKKLKEDIDMKISNIIRGLSNSSGLSVKDIQKKLTVARDYQNCRYNQYNIATISDIEINDAKETYIEANIAYKYNSPSLGNAHITHLDDFNKHLVEKYREKIESGVKSSQIRNIAGLRNAYKKISYKFDDNEKRLSVLHSSLHSSTLAVKVKDENQKNTILEQNIEQAKQFVKDSYGVEKLFFVSFNSPNNPIDSFERDIIKQCKKASKDHGFAYANSSMNGFRKFFDTPITDGYDEVLRDFVNQLYDVDLNGEKIINIMEYKDILDFISNTAHQKKEKDAYDAFNNMKKGDRIEENANLIKSIEFALETRRLLNKINSRNFLQRMFDKYNLNLQLFTSCEMLLEKARNHNPKLTDYAIIGGCKSGKDRTGIAQHMITAKSISEEDYAKVSLQLSKSRHHNYLAGSPHAGGGSVGAFGIKGAAYSVLPVSLQKSAKNIISKTASNNQINFIKRSLVSIIIDVIKTVLFSKSNSVPSVGDINNTDPPVGSEKVEGLSTQVKQEVHNKELSINTIKYVDNINNPNNSLPTVGNNKWKTYSGPRKN